MRTPTLLALSITIAPVSAPALGADSPSSHQHGHAEMQLAFSHNRVEVMLTSPAANLIGFEHEPRSPEQHQTLDKVTDWLGKTPLVNTPETTCTVQTGSVQHALAGDHEEHADHEEHSNEESAQSGPGRHADITVTQILTCPGLDKSVSLTTPLTARFPSLEHLDLAWAGPDGQGSKRLEEGEASFKLRR
ncbi:MAG TPA: DUF2796 domain-containing protein [Marinobacter sp.]|uniref:DUF2796 domain-containing protein n=2 Tax=root TaxID=1 RepID=A0A831QYS5_9GAMM|nr:DUF2796 domain-containing protein [Marinobacter antarcticus]HDZ38160.1 DUF2796 domain-containing protein [Marinobacter sp.]HEA50966.1 DUF2796 domain-containing protein [Marinobacter antarcticus]